jgi:hypothetical protein
LFGGGGWELRGGGVADLIVVVERVVTVVLCI